LIGIEIPVSPNGSGLFTQHAVDARSANAEPARDCRRTELFLAAQAKDFNSIDRRLTPRQVTAMPKLTMHMRVELAVALIAGVFALAAAGLSVWSVQRTDANARAIAQLQAANAHDIAQLKIDYDKLKTATQHQNEISKFSEPLARSAYDLQSRLYNILKQKLIEVYMVHGDNRERSYVIENTSFLIAQYFCWAELVRREIQFIDLGENQKTLELTRLQDTISSLWLTDEYPRVLRIFAGEQKAIGDALVNIGPQRPECMDYGTFLKSFNKGANPLIDFVRSDVASLDHDLNLATERLTGLQHSLIDLLEMLDPNYIRFPKAKRTKV
jgi:hypothetical protein